MARAKETNATSFYMIFVLLPVVCIPVHGTVVYVALVKLGTGS